MKAMLKKVLSVLLVVTITAGVAITGTLAYLTDRDSEANVFTVGDVSIDLNEDFNQGATLIPGVDIEKKPTITNTGKNDAWVWAEIAIPAALDNEDASKNVIHFNFTEESLEYWQWTDGGNYMVRKDVEIEGVKYNVYTVLYKDALKPGEITAEPVMTKVYMDDHIDIDPNGDWYHVENGVVSEKLWSEADGNPVIYVSAYAIQTEGFDTAMDAYKAYNEQWTTEDDVNNGLEWGTPATVVSDASEIKETLKNGGNVLLENDVEAELTEKAIYGTPTAIVQKNGGVIDGNGKSLDIIDPVYEGYAIETWGGTIKNLTIDSTVGRGIVISSPTEDVYIDNVVVDGPGYAINTTEHNGKNLYVTNSTIKGWTSLAGLVSASFTDCTFGENTSKYWQNMGYDQDYDRLIRPYITATFTDCDFEQGYYIDLSALGADCTVTLTDCTCNGVEITAENYNTYITIELPSGRTLADCVTFK